MMAEVHITLFSGLEVRRAGGSPVEIESRKARALLAYLAARPDRKASREQVCGLLWGDPSRLAAILDGLRLAGPEEA